MGQPRWLILLVVWSSSVLAPAALCLALALAPARSLADAAACSLAAAIWVSLIVLAGWWEFTSLHLRWVWWLLLAGVAVQRLGESAARSHSPGVAALLAALLGLAGAPLLLGAIAARWPDGGSTELRFPLRGGRFLVTDGGDSAKSFLVNYHGGFSRHRTAGVNESMRYAMDVVEVGRDGRGARGFAPRRNDAFRIWEKPLLAPCDGVVVHVVDGVPDNTAFGHDRPYGVGNHVVIRKDSDVYVVLGHMRCASVSVSHGAVVRAGDPIGRVGNSGWTERPHLHMQAMRSATGDWWHGQPLAMRFGGRFLARNQVAAT